MVLLSFTARRILCILCVACSLIIIFLTISLLCGLTPPIPLSAVSFQRSNTPKADEDPIPTTNEPTAESYLAGTEFEAFVVPPARVASEKFPYYVKHNKLPTLHPLNVPPLPSQRPETPLFIGFTRNWPILQQSVLSYIAAGWPADQIYVVDNTGTMDSNELGMLTLQNPFYVDYARLRSWGVKVLTTPTLLSFAQLQNYYLYTAVQKNWDRFFWGHMDGVALSHEDGKPYGSLYSLILKVLEKLDHWEKEHIGETWATKFFAYDRLALVNTEVFKKVGGWDTTIPYYFADCDMYGRLALRNYTLEIEDAGDIFDVGEVLEDLSVFFPSSEELELGKLGGDTTYDEQRKNTSSKVKQISPSQPSNYITANAHDALELSETHRVRYSETLDSQRYKLLKAKLREMEIAKNTAPSGRNFWQGLQAGGQGEPFHRDSNGFERAIQMTIRHGAEVYAAKWGWKGEEEASCDLSGNGKQEKDAWRNSALFLR